jgi:cation diffusion facilitator family transporter
MPLMFDNPTVRLAIGSIVLGTAVFGLKAIAAYITGSVALFSDALESVVNVATAVTALLAIQFSAKPADANHPFGHSKAEYFSAVLEGVLIILAAVAILRESYFGLLDPQPMEAPATGLAINALATIINAGWAFVLIRHGRRRRSPALVADGQHLVTDVLTSIGVFIGLVLANLTGIAVLDPLLAALVALNILWTGWRIMKASVGGLMDEAAPADVVDRVREVISDTGEGAIEAHDVRTRHAGHTTFVEFHLVVPGDMSVFTAHEICDRIEAALRQEVEGAVVTIHVEPENKAKHSGIVVI